MTDPDRLYQLATANDRDYTQALLHYLAKPDDAGAALFRHPSLLRRTRATLGQLMVLADQRDRKPHPDQVRAQWRAVRAAVRRERDAINALPPPEAGPRRRALHRLADEYPDEYAAIKAAAPKTWRRKALETLAARHPVRIIELVRQERARDDEAAAGQ